MSEFWGVFYSSFSSYCVCVCVRDMSSTDLVLTVAIGAADWKLASARPLPRLTHPATLTHTVIFLPLTAPLAAADTNRMRRPDARLDAAEVAEEL